MSIRRLGLGSLNGLRGHILKDVSGAVSGDSIDILCLESLGSVERGVSVNGIGKPWNVLAMSRGFTPRDFLLCDGDHTRPYL